MTKKEKNKALLEGCKEGDFNKVRLAINFGADVETKDVNGETPLHWAILNDSIETIKFLIEAGVNVNFRADINIYKSGLTPLHRAGGICIVRDLLGAYENRRETPLHWASRYNHIKMTKLFLDAGADLEAKDKEGKTPLDVADSDEMKALLKKYIK